MKAQAAELLLIEKLFVTPLFALAGLVLFGISAAAQSLPKDVSDYEA